MKLAASALHGRRSSYTISFDLMQQQASIRLERGWAYAWQWFPCWELRRITKRTGAFSFQRLTNVCLQAPEALFRSSRISFFTNWWYWLLQSLYTVVVVLGMPCAVHKQGIVCASGDNRQLYVHQQQNYSIHQERWWNCLWMFHSSLHSDLTYFVRHSIFKSRHCWGFSLVGHFLQLIL